MALPIEGYTVVAQRSRIQDLLDRKEITIPNSTALADDDLWRISFMTAADASAFVAQLELKGLNASRGPDSDAVVINEFDQSIEPYCEWLQTGRWEKAVIGWLAGTEPRKVVAREGWDPKVGSGLSFRTSNDADIELLRVENNMEVYRDKKTGKELFIGRSETPVESLYEIATGIVSRHLRNPGEPVREGEAAEEVRRAIEMLDRVLQKVSTDWRVYWFHGKGHSAIGDRTKAYASLHRAFELEKGETVIARELAGVCLEVGKFDEAVVTAERAVSLAPDDDGLIANLGLAHLLAGNVQAALKAIDAAIKRGPNDPVNLLLKRIIYDVAHGRRSQPRSMAELTSPQEPTPKSSGEKMIVQCECGGKVNTEAKQCPHCGKPGPFGPPPPPPAPSLLPQLLLAIVLSIVGLAIVYMLVN